MYEFLPFDTNNDYALNAVEYYHKHMFNKEFLHRSKWAYASHFMLPTKVGKPDGCPLSPETVSRSLIEIQSPTGRHQTQTCTRDSDTQERQSPCLLLSGHGHVELCDIRLSLLAALECAHPANVLNSTAVFLNQTQGDTRSMNRSHARLSANSSIDDAYRSSIEQLFKLSQGIE
mmetsp:Transcript_37944/g.108369  ORF Transcript_37944/g.108369 Transcript_37944/m.108369 type:complete len:174 (-) Transcript_37944:100-621(-)